jgi:hypothetical protein
MLRAIIRTLEGESPEVRDRIMMACGRECASLPCPPKWNISLDMVYDITSKTMDVKERIGLLNELVPWCSEWIMDKDSIISECMTCGCLLVQNGLVEPSEVWCECSLGWVKAIFEVIFQGPVQVKLASAIGRGDRTCKYMVTPSYKSVE